MYSFTLPQKGPFRILQMTDLHATHGSKEDEQTFAMVEDLVKAERPDLIIFTGDVFTDNEGFHPAEMEDACRRFDALEIPWVLVMGNHEGTYRHGEGVREKKGDFIAKHSKNVLFEQGPADIFGVGNFAIGLLSPEGKPLWTLYSIDSNNRAFYPVNGVSKVCEDHIHTDQIEWYRQTARQIREKHGKVPALAFFHIPLPEFTDAWLFEEIIGDRFEHVTAATLNSGFFAAAVEEEEIVAMFAGHDHTNSYRGNVFGITLAYGRCTSYHCNLGEFPRGGRMIVLSEDQTMETYIALHRKPEDRNGLPAVYRQEETKSAPFYDRFNFCPPPNIIEE